MVVVYYFLLFFTFRFSFTRFVVRFLLDILPLVFARCSDHSEYLPTARSADPRDTTSSVLHPHTFFISHISPNLTLHTISFCCQLAIFLMLGYKISSFRRMEHLIDITSIFSTAQSLPANFFAVPIFCRCMILIYTIL